MKNNEEYPFSAIQDFAFFNIAFGVVFGIMYSLVYLYDGGDILNMLLFWAFSTLGSSTIAFIATRKRNK